MITERTLKKWRRDALTVVTDEMRCNQESILPSATLVELTQRILRMTQELMDLHLTKYERSKSR